MRDLTYTSGGGGNSGSYVQSRSDSGNGGGGGAVLGDAKVDTALGGSEAPEAPVGSGNAGD